MCDKKKNHTVQTGFESLFSKKYHITISYVTDQIMVTEQSVITI